MISLFTLHVEGEYWGCLLSHYGQNGTQVCQVLRSFAAIYGNSLRRFHGNVEQLYSAAIWSVTQGSVSLVQVIVV